MPLVKSRSLPTRFGRRMLLSFLLVAATPVVLVALYALFYFSSVNRQQQDTRLFDAVRAQGHLVLDRLQHANRLVNEMPVEQLRRSPVFSQIRLDESPTPGVALVIDPVNDSHVSLVVEKAGQTLHATIDVHFLWGGLVTLSTGVQMCFFSSAGDILHCQIQDGALDAIQLLELRPPGFQSTFEFQFEAEPYAAAAWDLFLGADFGSPSWQVIGFESAQSALEPFNLQNFLPALTLLSLAFAALAALYVLRQRLQPFDELLSATRRLSESDFSRPVKIDSGDELQALGSSFNEMMGRLGNQMRRLAVDSRIDRLILESGSVAEVVDLIMEHGQRYVSCHRLVIGIMDQDIPGSASVQVTIFEAEVQSRLFRAKIQPEMLQAIRSAFKPVRPGDLGPVIGLEMAPAAALVNIMWEDALLGFIAVDPAPDLEHISGLQELRDRVTLALSASEQSRTLFQQAHFDTLTGLPNRFLLADRLKQLCSRGPQQPFAVMFLDLDRFKNVNDSLGHSAGDALLIEVGRRLVEMFPEPNTIARLGGDEFMVVLQQADSPAAVNEAAADVLDSIGQEIFIDDSVLKVSASIGVALYPTDGIDAEELLRNSDAAMYRSKDDGRSRITFFTLEINASVLQRFVIEKELREALVSDDLEIYFQPQRALSSNKISGMEALVRWPKSGFGPAEFIPVAEDSGLIIELGRWILDSACREFARIPDHFRPRRFSVNVSARECGDEQFVATVLDTLARHELAPKDLEIEMTETALMEDAPGVKRNLASLRDSGIAVALDDFGTGYSSLRFLQEMPVNVIKIDRTFVTRVDIDDRQRAFIETVVELGRRLGMTTIAEGAETGEEFQALADLGCGAVQGYFFARPMPMDALIDFLVDFECQRAGGTMATQFSRLA